MACLKPVYIHPRSDRAVILVCPIPDDDMSSHAFRTLCKCLHFPPKQVVNDQADAGEGDFMEYRIVVAGLNGFG
jgi:hypothetical protein